LCKEPKEGAYALIDRNAFCDKLHAIAFGGKSGFGYLAYRNLVLHHGGVAHASIRRARHRGLQDVRSALWSGWRVL